MLRTLPDESVHCVVTSPPYWGLRDYGVPGQMGLEPTLGEHISAMVDVFREVRRVLRKDGTCWLNYGDCYATQPAGNKAIKTDERFRSDTTTVVYGGNKPFSTVQGNMKPKDLCMIPNRLAIALQDDGWWVRSEIIWAKPNPMPESIRDRPTSAHEKIFLLTKSARYFYDAEAVRTAAKSNGDCKMPDGWDTGPGAHGSFHREGREKGRKSDKQRGHGRRHAGFNDRWDAMPKAEQLANGANLRNVWTVPTRGYREAHFATFPAEIPERCIKAGCPKDGVVLDPFAGAGTVGLVANRLQRKAILIELSREYCEMARQRIEAEMGMFGHVIMGAADASGN